MSGRPSTSSVTHGQAAPTVPAAVHNLAAPSPILIDSQLPSYLLPNVLDLLRDSTRHVVSRKRQQEDQLREEGLLPPADLAKGKGKATAEDEARAVDEETARKVERIGLMVGSYIAEKLTLARAPLASHLDIIKFICKDLFLYVYSKQIDNLRTNHRGVYVLQSHAFPPLLSISSSLGPAHDMEAAKPHLIYPQALIQGALTRLGLPAFVTAECSGLPQCTFQIKTVKSTQLPPSASTTPALASSTAGLAVQLPGHPQPSRPASTGLGIASAGMT